MGVLRRTDRLLGGTDRMLGGADRMLGGTDRMLGGTNECACAIGVGEYVVESITDGRCAGW